MDNMKFIKVVRENLKNPKKKSLTLLVLYAIFFIFVFAVLHSVPTKDDNNIEEPNNIKDTIDVITIVLSIITSLSKSFFISSTLS